MGFGNETRSHIDVAAISKVQRYCLRQCAVLPVLDIDKNESL